MKKYIKYSLISLGSLLGILLLVIIAVAAVFNPNDYKQQVIDLVQEKKQRTLTLEGDIKLSFWPKIGADLGKVSISEHKGSKQFAAVDSVKVSLDLMPLLRNVLIVDTIYIDGARANIVKYKDGTTNFDDLLSKEQESKNIKFDIDGINVINSAATYADESSGASYAISKVNLKTGHVALAEPIDLTTDFTVQANQPEVSANVTIKGEFLVDVEGKHFSAKGLDATVNGELLGGKDVNIQASGDIDAKPKSSEFLVDGLKVIASGLFDGAKMTVDLNAPQLKATKDEVTSQKVDFNFTQTKGDDSLKANMVMADIKGTQKVLQSTGIVGEIIAVQGKRNIASKFSSPFNGNLESLVFDLPKLAGIIDIKDSSLPNGAIKGVFELSLHTDAKQELVNSKFNFKVDNTKLNGDVAVAGFKQPNIKFNLNADTLDLNKLLGKSSNKAAKKSPASQAPADLSALKTLLLNGNLKVGHILYDTYKLSGLNVAIKANGENLSLTGINVKFDDSQIRGNLGISQFAKPLYTFDIDIDTLDLDKYVISSTKTDAPKSDKPIDLSALKALNADGSLRIGKLKYGKTKASNIRIDLKADGQKLSLSPLAAKVDDSQINATIDIARLNDPIYRFNLNIDKVDADRYISKNEKVATKTNSADAPIDLSILKKLNASGEAKVGWLKIANIKTQNVNISFKAADGMTIISPFSANLYQGSMNGLLKVDARATPSITLKQSMQGINIGPLLIDAINNDMLEGKGSLNLDIMTTGNTVLALKKALAGNAAVNLADGAVKGVDIAGSIRDIQSKVNVLKNKNSVTADQNKKTDFSELTATFNIKNGVAHNEDLAMKAPILRLAKGDARGDIDIGNETINYLAKPSIVKSLKGQGGAELDALAGFSIPVKVTGSFSVPKFGMDFAAIGAALAKSKLLDSIGGDKAEALKGLLGGNKEPVAVPATGSAAPAEAPKSTKEQAKDEAKKRLNEILGF